MDGVLSIENLSNPQSQTSPFNQAQVRHVTEKSKTKRRICFVVLIIALLAILGCVEAICVASDYCLPPSFSILVDTPPSLPPTEPPTEGVRTLTDLRTSQAMKTKLRTATWNDTALVSFTEGSSTYSRFSSNLTSKPDSSRSPSKSTDNGSQTSQHASPSTLPATTSAAAAASSTRTSVVLNATASAATAAASPPVLSLVTTSTALSTGSSISKPGVDLINSPSAHSAVVAASSHASTSESVRNASTTGSPPRTSSMTASTSVKPTDSKLGPITSSAHASSTSSSSEAATPGRQGRIDVSARARPPPERYDADYKPGMDSIPGIPEHFTELWQLEQWFRRLPVAKRTGDHYLPMVISSIAYCASIGKDLLLEGGSAVDAAIASQICHGFLNPVSAGIGGGSFMVVYDENRNMDVVFNGREAAPTSVNVRQYETNPSLAREGGLAIAIPGEVAAFYRAWKQFGKVPWNKLFTRTIYWCEQGYDVSEELQQTLRQHEAFLRSNAVLSEDYVVNGTLLSLGDKLRRRRLGHTLRRIAHDPTSFYKGSLARDILSDVAERGAKWKASDLSDYQALTTPALRHQLTNMELTLLASPPPSLGAIVGHAVTIADWFSYVPSNWRPEVYNPNHVRATTHTVHQVVEAIKYGFALRDNIGDPRFNPDVKEFMELIQDPNMAKEDKASMLNYAFSFRSYFKRLSPGDPWPELTRDAGVLDAVQTSAIDEEGLVVSIASSIGQGFGSKIVGRRTGIVFNSAMADFSTVQSTMFKKRVNWIAPGARPASVMAPVILVNKAFRAEGSLGATRGMRGVSSLIWTILNRYAFRAWFTEIEDRMQFHPDLITNTVELHSVTDWVADLYVELLKRFGHRLSKTEHIDEPQVPSLMKSDEIVWYGLPFRQRARGLLSYGGVA